MSPREARGVIYPPCMGEANCGGVPVAVIVTDIVSLPVCRRCQRVAESRPPHPGYAVFRIEEGDRAEVLLAAMRDQRPS
jgi:hypothetical protein